MKHWCSLAAALAVLPAVVASQPAPPDVRVATAARPGAGYTVEARVPWALVGVSPRDGLRVGFDVHVNDADGPDGVRARKLVWAGTPGDDQYRDPGRFGTVVLGTARDGLAGLPAIPGPTLDGERDAPWGGAARLPLVHVRQGAAPSASDLAAVAYDADALYVLVDVTDDRVRVGPNDRPYLDDGVEIYLDGGNDKAGAYDADDLKLTLRPGLAEAFAEGRPPPGGYLGSAPDAPWRAAAERIDRVRKADLTVHVEDAEGRPVEGAEVRVAMRRHAFAFGSFDEGSFLVDDRKAAASEARFGPEFVAREPGTGALPDSLADDQRRYQQAFARLFNHATVGFYWGGWYQDPEPRLASLAWFQDHGITVRGHPLVWPAWPWLTPEMEARADEPTFLRQRVRTHIYGLLATPEVRRTIHEWDVVNEARDNHVLQDALRGPPGDPTSDGVLADAFRWARESAPGAHLYLNENGILGAGSWRSSRGVDHMTRLVRRIDALCPGCIDGVGVQSHVAVPLPPPDTVLAVFDRLGALSKRVKVTEFDMTGVSEEVGGRYLRDFLTAVFSHPAADGFVMWGFWDGNHWRGSAPVYRRDWSIKPSGQAYQDLVLGEWWTDETATTGPDGAARVRGFLGDYAVTVRHDGRETEHAVTLQRADGDVTVRVPQ